MTLSNDALQTQENDQRDSFVGVNHLMVKLMIEFFRNMNLKGENLERES